MLDAASITASHQPAGTSSILVPNCLHAECFIRLLEQTKRFQPLEHYPSQLACATISPEGAATKLPP